MELIDINDLNENKKNILVDRLEQLLSAIRESFMASHKSRSAQKYLRSHASIDYEQRRHMRHHTHIIHPFSSFRHMWDSLMVITIIFGLVIFPYQVAFDMTRQYHIPWTIIKNMFVMVCCLDIIINFLTGYFDKIQSMVEMKPRRIAITYIKRMFIFDLVGSFPTDLMFLDEWDYLIVKRELYSLFFVFRIFSLSSYSNKLVVEHDVRHAFFDFFSTIFWVVMAVHWQACLFWIVPVAAASMNLPRKPSNDSWFYELWELESDITKYSYCLLQSIATFMHSGFLMNIKPQTMEDQVLIIVFKFGSTLIFCFLIARIMQFFKGLHASKLKYQSTLAHLSQYMSHKQLPHRTQNRIAEYYEFRYQGRYFREKEILGILSTQMCQEIRMHSCRKLVENVTFFKNLPLSLLARIVTLLKSELVLVNDIIVKANQTGNCMYFIASGTVAVYTSTGKEVCHLEDGAHFGEIALVMPDAKRVASVVAVETSKLYKLERDDFARTIHPYPLLWERIKKIALERHEKTTIMNAS